MYLVWGVLFKNWFRIHSLASVLSVVGGLIPPLAVTIGFSPSDSMVNCPLVLQPKTCLTLCLISNTDALPVTDFAHCPKYLDKGPFVIESTLLLGSVHRNPSVVTLHTSTSLGKALSSSETTPLTNDVMCEARYGLVILDVGNEADSPDRVSKTFFFLSPALSCRKVELPIFPKHVLQCFLLYWLLRFRQSLTKAKYGLVDWSVGR